MACLVLGLLDGVSVAVAVGVLLTAINVRELLLGLVSLRDLGVSLVGIILWDEVVQV